MISFKTASTLLATAAVLSLAPIRNAEAATFGFQNIANGDTVGDTFVNQFSLDVTEVGGKALFKVIYGSGGFANSFIGSFYLDDKDGDGSKNAFFSKIEFSGGSNSSPGVAYDIDDPAKNFPQGNNVDPNFPFESDFSANRASGSGNSKAINPNEFGSFLFTLQPNITFSNVTTGLEQGTLRAGIHVQGLAGNGSDSFVTSPTPVPTPALLPGLIGMGVAALRKRKGEAEESTEA